jgi:hypothetical protein
VRKITALAPASCTNLTSSGVNKPDSATTYLHKIKENVLNEEAILNIEKNLEQ